MSEGMPTSIRMLLLSALGRGRTGMTHEEAEQSRQARMMNEEARLIEMRRMAGPNNAMRYSRPNIFVGASIHTSHGDISGDGAFPSMTPIGMDEGMVRLASVEAGKDLAKYAGILGTAWRNPRMVAPVVAAGGLYAMGKVNKGVQFGLENLDEAIAPPTGFVPESMKLGGIGGGLVAGIGGQLKDFGSKVLKAGRKTGPLGAVAAVATVPAMMGLNKTTHAVGGALEKEVKSYTYNRGGNQLPTTRNEYGYVTPPALQY